MPLLPQTTSANTSASWVLYLRQLGNWTRDHNQTRSNTLLSPWYWCSCFVVLSMLQFSPAHQHTLNLTFIFNPIDLNDAALTHRKIKYLAELRTLCHDGINDIGPNPLRHQSSRGQSSYCSLCWALCRGYPKLQTLISIRKNVLQLWDRKEHQEVAEMLIQLFPVTLHHVSEIQAMMARVIHAHLACKDTDTSNNINNSAPSTWGSAHFLAIYLVYTQQTFTLKCFFMVPSSQTGKVKLCNKH